MLTSDLDLFMQSFLAMKVFDRNDPSELSDLSFGFFQVCSDLKFNLLSSLTEQKGGTIESSNECRSWFEMSLAIAHKRWS